LGSNPQAVMGLFITEFTEDTTTIRWLPHLYEVRHGQIWRLITPIFIHFGLLHILFNMWCLRDLGSMIEGRQNTWILGALVLVTATGSNVLQFYMVSPYFGGMSGVLYALLGYVWIRGKLDPASGLFLRPTTVTMMIVWFFVCWTGLIGAANYAHTGGLLIGMAWGYLSALRYR
jgi:GlpG protein